MHNRLQLNRLCVRIFDGGDSLIIAKNAYDTGPKLIK